MTKLTRTQKAARLDAFLSNENNFEFVSYNDPRAAAIRAKDAKTHKRRVAARSAALAASVEKAAAFEVGQPVKMKARPFSPAATIVSIQGDVVRLDNGRAFIAAMLIGA